jgi:hypothetical protein
LEPVQNRHHLLEFSDAGGYEIEHGEQVS